MLSFKAEREMLVICRAQLHARNRGKTWKEYLHHLEKALKKPYAAV